MQRIIGEIFIKIMSHAVSIITVNQLSFRGRSLHQAMACRMAEDILEG
ncbi:MAG: hypothetical protein OXE78_08640 [Gammaproteobacteria bacterium]|nr:hypothetical protein [Gammaproteobacteria bacterium]